MKVLHVRPLPASLSSSFPFIPWSLGTSGLSHVLFLFLGTHFLFLVYFIPTHPSQVTLLSRPGPNTSLGSPYFLLSPWVAPSCPGRTPGAGSCCMSQGTPGRAATDSRVSHSPRRPLPQPLRTPALLTCRCEGRSNRTDWGMPVLVGWHPRG